MEPWSTHSNTEMEYKNSQMEIFIEAIIKITDLMDSELTAGVEEPPTKEVLKMD
jgi:hypothetical protein